MHELALATLLNTLIVIGVVLVHYEVLYQMARRMPRLVTTHRYRVLVGVAMIMLAHIAEIWLFAAGFYTLRRIEGMGDLHGLGTEVTLLECSYFSFTTFTTVGFGDVFPTGYLRYLGGLESLTGFVLITWSASFLFLEMQKYWPNLDPQKGRRHE